VTTAQFEEGKKEIEVVPAQVEEAKKIGDRSWHSRSSKREKMGERSAQKTMTLETASD
jgi:hypothetical protein